FQKIHDDVSIDERGKYEYLIQSTVPGSTLRENFESFPATAENYKKAVEYLKERFGKESALVQVYIKDLLQLVISKNKCELSTLYDKLQTGIRSLDSLGLTKDKYADILFPLVESTLPIDIVKMWDRQRHLVQDIQVHCSYLPSDLSSIFWSERPGDMGKNMLQKLNRLRGMIRDRVTRLNKAAESYEPPATPEESEIILNQKLQNVLELKAQMKKLLADYLDLPESTNLEEPLEVIYNMEEEIEDLQVKFKILLTK
ncbi:hypothetical protein AVEN_73271-1, partial [Araneus ventricosus]